jgi:hypothetical protein
MMPLTKTRSILHATTRSDGYLTFERILDEVDAPQRSIRIDEDDWYAMGEPGVVTVTIEPGDLLNIEE